MRINYSFRFNFIKLFLLFFKNKFAFADTIQITTHNTALNTNYKIVHSHMEHHSEHQEPPKKALLATVRASHARGRCRQGQVRQLLAEAHMCPSHPHGTPSRCIAGPLPSSDVEEAEEPEESEHK